jgi:hypothetical protein
LNATEPSATPFAKPQGVPHIAWVIWKRMFACIACLCCLSAARADEKEVAWLRETYLADAKTYRFAGGADGKDALQFEPQAVMHWASPDDWSGDLFVWSRRGRPEVIGCMLAGPNEAGRRRFYHEFHALSVATPPDQRFPDGNAWKLSSPPLEMKPVADVPGPYVSAKPWLAQMRDVAKGYTFGTIFQGGTWELRLLPQPIHKYRNPALSKAAGKPSGKDRFEWHEGAIFAFVQSTGTDAEALLVVEARETAEGVRWHYAPVRMTNNPLWLKQGDNELWRVKGHSDPRGDKSLPYTTFFAGFKKVP